MSGSISSKVFKLRYADSYEWLLPTKQENFELLQFDGRPRKSSWTPVEMKRVRVSSEGRPLRPGDFYACSGGDMLIFGETAKDILGRELERYGEVLPLTCEGQPFWTLNVTSFVDALDESASQVVRASDTGAILVVQRHVMKPTALLGTGLFKLPETPRGLIYATDAIARRLRESSLVGLELVQVWARD